MLVMLQTTLIAFCFINVLTVFGFMELRNGLCRNIFSIEIIFCLDLLTIQQLQLLGDHEIRFQELLCKWTVVRDAGGNFVLLQCNKQSINLISHVCTIIIVKL